MQVAEQLLATTNDSAKSIAIQAGYANANYFYSTFERHSGLTPTEFRRARGSV